MVDDNQGPTNNTVTILHENICGLRRKTDELISSISPNFPQVLCFSEYHLKIFKLDQNSINGYKLGAAHSRRVLKGGGVCIFVRNTLECTSIDLDKYCKEQDIEICMLKLTPNLHNILIMAIYRPPAGNFNLFLQRLDDILKSVYRVDSKLILCGDINVDYLTENEKKRQLDAMLLTYGLAPIVHFPTRTQGSSCTAIDNIFLDTNTFFNYTISPLYNGLADHDAQLLIINDLNLHPHNQGTINIRSLDTYSIEEFKTRLSYESWENVFNHNVNTNVDTLFNSFLNDYLRLFHSSFPPRKISKRSNNNSWITPDIKTSCKRKRFLYLLTKNSDDINLKNYYKQYCKTLTTVIKEAKSNMYNKRIKNSTNRMKTIWNIIKAETNRAKETTDIDHNNCQNSPEAFNRYFLSIPQNIIDSIRSNVNQYTYTAKNPSCYLANLFHASFPSIKFQNTSTREIEKIINSLRMKNSCGYDEISTKVLKLSAPYISSPLCYICNKSMLSGIFPARLKYATIKPLLKTGDKENIANYRPISLLTSFSKVLEKLIYNRLLNHIQTNNILRAEQFGFRVSLSTEKASYKLIDDILNAFNNKTMIGGIFCDLQKAFDCIDHNILLAKLEFYGITGVTYKLIKSYLQGRYQRVVLNNYSPHSHSYSHWGGVTYGVPQGSILGPLLFLLYINDLPQLANVNSKFVLFADDTSVIITNPDPHSFRISLNKITHDIHEWFETNLLSLNFDKTHYIQFMTRNNSSNDLDIIHRSRKLTMVKSTKFLGLTLHATLSWRPHIDTIAPKLSSAGFALRIVKPLLSPESLRMVYFSYFHAIMTYGIIFWGNSSHSNIIFRLQKRVIRIITGIRNRDSCREYFKALKILPLQSQYILSLLLFVIDNKDHFKRNSEVHHINTRNKSSIHQPHANLSIYQKGAYYTGIKVFNSLPSQIRELSHSRHKFKHTLKEFLLTHSFYTLDEFFNFNCRKAYSS